MKRRVIGMMLIIAAMVLLLGGPFSSAQAQDKKPLTDAIYWGIRAAQGATYVMDLSLLKLWEEKLKIKCFSTQIASSVAAFPKMKEGKLDIWRSGMRDGYLAARGLDEYNGQKYPLRTFLKAADNHFGFVVLPKSGIKKIEDLAGKTITYTSERAVTMTECGTALLEYYKILDKVKDLANLQMTEKHAALIEGKAASSLEGLPNLEIIWRDAPDAFPLKISKEAGEYAAGKYPWFWAEEAPKDWRMYKGNYVGAGPGLDYPYYAVTTPTLLFCNAAASEELIYTLMKTMYDNFDVLLKTHPFWSDYAKEKVTSDKVTLPFHEGAVKYFKEQGIWTPAMDANQKKQLAAIGASK